MDTFDDIFWCLQSQSENNLSHYQDTPNDTRVRLVSSAEQKSQTGTHP